MRYASASLGKSELYHNLTPYLLSDIGNKFPLLFSNLPAWFLEKVGIAKSGCWIWLGSTGFHPKYPQHRYGQLKVTIGFKQRRSTSAHRYAWECMFGPVEKGIDVDHLCEVKLCVNPDHLQLLSHWDNCKKRRTK